MTLMPQISTAMPGPPERFVRLPGGRFRMGSDEKILPQDGEGPSRLVRVRPFAIDPHAVTNRWFSDFVAATGYRTQAEVIGWAAVFAGLLSADDPRRRTAAQSRGASWWIRADGACWRDPEGAGSDVSGRLDHPVVQVSWNDAAAFARWAGGRLPSEAEWEYAARGGLDAKRFPWGDLEPDDEANLPCNIWQGEFPVCNTARDGYAGTAPVNTFAPNGFGLHNMVGNTWEWCADAFRIASLAREARRRNADAATSGARVLKGGSFLCHRSYCYRYRPAARSGAPADTAASHTGFRIVYSVT